MKRPAFQFYPADWRKDLALRKCSIAARGMWVELMCIAHECEPYGTLRHNGDVLQADDIAGLVGMCSPREAKALIDELVRKGVAKLDADGVIYSKRMVHDEAVRNARAEGGKAGAEHGSKGAEHGSKGGRPPTDKGGSKGGYETPLSADSKPPPSSSSSPSGNASEAIASGGKPPTMTPEEIIFGYGVPLLVSAGSTDKAARSFLGGLRKSAGDDGVVVNALRDCIRAKPLQPLEWLAKALPPASVGGKQTALERRNAAVAAELGGMNA